MLQVIEMCGELWQTCPMNVSQPMCNLVQKHMPLKFTSSFASDLA